MQLEFKPAFRKAVPQLIGISGVSGSGKTYSALLLARGLAGAMGRVGFVDTENGRGEMYADSPGIKAAYKDHAKGIYEYLRMDPPFSPARYIEFITAAESAGLAVICVDSLSHEWEGTGGCCEIAEKQKLGGMPNWAKAKLEHKKFINHLLSTNVHIVFCLRARDKVKIFSKGDRMILDEARVEQATDAPIAEKNSVVPVGLTAIAEKGFVHELTVHLMLDERTHHVVPAKVPEPLQPLFAKGRMLTVEDGARIREWNEGGTPADPFEIIRKRARAEAGSGMVAYQKFFASLTGPQKKSIIEHEENKRIAAEADRDAEAAVPEYAGDELPDEMSVAVGFECWWTQRPGMARQRMRITQQEGEAPKWTMVDSASL